MGDLNLAILRIIKGIQAISPLKPLSDIVPNIIPVASFKARVSINGNKQIQIHYHTERLYIFVCTGRHNVSSKHFNNLKHSKYKLRIIDNKPVLMFGDAIIFDDFSDIPEEFNVMYWVSWKTKNHPDLRSRSDVFCKHKGELTNKLTIKKCKYNKKYQKSGNGILYKSYTFMCSF